MYSKPVYKQVKSDQCPSKDFNLADTKVERVENKDFKWSIGLPLVGKMFFIEGNLLSFYAI